MLTFTNPRLHASFPDWPSGKFRVECLFQVHHVPGRGWRVERTTKDPKTGRWCKPKQTTYGGPTVIVEGSDGRTYILVAAPAPYGRSITVKRSDFMDAAEELGRKSAYVPAEGYGADPELFAALAALIEQGAGVPPFPQS